MKSFWEKYRQLGKSVCVGLDSDFKQLPAVLKNEHNPIVTFNKAIIDATKDLCGCYKLNYAFYLAGGTHGMEALLDTLGYIPQHIPVILDVKVGDIGNTMQAYAKAYFSEFKVDAVTVNPLMGSDVFAPLLTYREKMIFVLALTSNKSAAEYLKTDLAARIARQIAGYDYQCVGAVVGATNTDELAAMRKLMPETLFLVPGVGAQGGDLSAVIKYAAYAKTDPRLLINSSRGIIFASSGANFAEEARRQTELLDREIRTCLN